ECSEYRSSSESDTCSIAGGGKHYRLSIKHHLRPNFNGTLRLAALETTFVISTERTYPIQGSMRIDCYYIVRQ
ncbi:MAG: hypothetical protein WCE93_09455, partial [Nitrososphaeraceae archaeon]